MISIKALLNKSYLDILGDHLSDHDVELKELAEELSILESIILELETNTLRKKVRQDVVNTVIELFGKDNTNQLLAVALSYTDDVPMFLNYIQSAWQAVASKIHLIIIDTRILLEAFEVKAQEFDHYFIKGANDEKSTRFNFK